MERLNFVSLNGTFHGKRGFPETYTKISERNFFVFTSSRRFGLDCPWELERAHPRGHLLQLSTERVFRVNNPFLLIDYPLQLCSNFITV